MIWELPKVETAMNEMYHFNYSETFVTGTIHVTGDNQDAHTRSPTPQPMIAIVGSGKEKKTMRRTRFCG